jgi:two-component system OmpR family sensor kinase
MGAPPRRALFWKIYPLLLGSVLLVALLGAILFHLLGMVPMVPGQHMRRHRLAGGAGSLGFLLLIAAAVGFGAYPVMARITRRLEALRRSVEAWGAGDQARRAAVDGDDEIAAVASSFNAAADRAAALLTAHKSLLAHASHELRSPLARLSVAAEMVAAGADPQAAAGVRREIAELDALVEEILLASRLDHTEDIGERESVDCLALAAEEAARVGVAVRDVAPGSGPYEVSGSPRLLRRLIRNLLENALKHGAPPIEVSVAHGEAAGAPCIVIAVSDHGAGIPAELRERVFEPFFRPAGQSEASGSWGLGLALVRQIAQLHGGRASCECGEGGGTTFTVELAALR